MNELTDLTVAVMPWVMVNSLLVCTLIAMVFSGLVVFVGPKLSEKLFFPFVVVNLAFLVAAVLALGSYTTTMHKEVINEISSSYGVTVDDQHHRQASPYFLNSKAGVAYPITDRDGKDRMCYTEKVATQDDTMTIRLMCTDNFKPMPLAK